MTREEFRDSLFQLYANAADHLPIEDVHAEMMLAHERSRCAYEIAFVTEVKRRMQSKKDEEDA